MDVRATLVNNIDINFDAMRGKNWRLLAAMLLIAFSLCASTQDAPETVYWASSSAPGQPVYKHYLNIQLGFETQKLLFKHLPDYKVEYRPQNTLRVFKELQQEKNVCTDTKVRTPSRDKVGYATSKPQIMLMGLKLVVNKDNAMFTDTDHGFQFDLNQFMQQHPKALMGVVAGRSYGATVDAEMNKLRQGKRIYERSAAQGTIGALDMLVERWVDVILDYPPLTNHYLRQRGDQSSLSKIRYFNVKNVPEFTHGYIYCSKSEFGQKLIAELDKVLPVVAKQKAYFEAHLNYVLAENHSSFARAYNQMYSTNF